MKMIDIRWAKNRKTKKSSLKLVDRAKWNSYPLNTATVDMVGITKKHPELKVTFYFPQKKGKQSLWDGKIENISWPLTLQANLIYNETEQDYDYYFNFPLGKGGALMNEREFEIVYSTMRNIKCDLADLLTGCEDGFITSK